MKIFLEEIIISQIKHKNINPDFEKVDNLVKRAIDDCTQHFHRYNYKCEFILKFTHATMAIQKFHINK